MVGRAAMNVRRSSPRITPVGREVRSNERDEAHHAGLG